MKRIRIMLMALVMGVSGIAFAQSQEKGIASAQSQEEGSQEEETRSAVVFSQKHGIYQSALSLSMSLSDGVLKDGQCIRYAFGGAEPTALSPVYNGVAKRITENSVVRAAIFEGEERVSDITTATYLFEGKILAQGNSPSGYPTQWGPYCEIKGTAPADYEMDPEMTKDATLKQKIIDGLYALPSVSIVTDKSNLFSKEVDEKTGGIYIYTGAPVGDGTGRDWERQISLEYFGGQQEHDLTVDCGLKIHGGHSRLAEKTPKHSFRLMFKTKYGPDKLKYKVFAPWGKKKFNQLVLRSMFGNTWTHWMDGNRTKAQYQRDAWARETQRQMGHPTSLFQYVHLYINGMYWGVYNLSERIDDRFAATKMGGEKEDYDVIKVEEATDNSIEASDGTMDKWNEMTTTAAQCRYDAAYWRKLTGMGSDGRRDSTQEQLLDVDNFIDYMLINQYGGNNDWDHHNWLAMRNRVTGKDGFRFLCWDAELIFEGVDDNALNKLNEGHPTSIFQKLMEYQGFRHRYMDRAHELLEKDGGLLTPQKTVERWDSIYNIIRLPLYDEAARWGDYRRDVHPYTSGGKLNTVDGRFMTERTRLVDKYFPYRTQKVITQMKDKGWYPTVKTPQLKINGVVDDDAVEISLNDNVYFVTSGILYYTTDGTDPIHWCSTKTGSMGATAKAVSVRNLKYTHDASLGATVHLRAVTKVNDEYSFTMDRTLIIKELVTDILDVEATKVSPKVDGVYDLSGRRLPEGASLTPGIYIINGKKVVVE